jgi:hypothetical protein
VALALARAGHEVVALDCDPSLLSELDRRADGLSVTTIAADARDFELGPERRFPLAIVPMQTVQLLGGPAGRAAFLACVRRHLTPAAVLAIAIAEQFEEFELQDGEPGPLPDMQELDGVLYSSLPTAVRREGERVILERRREVVDSDGARTVSHDRIALDVVSSDELEREGRDAGLRSLAVRHVHSTVEHIGSEVVILGA